MTVQAAHYEAERSEQELLNHLQSVGAGGYLQASALASDDQAVVSHASLDAHVKKVQADQIDSMNSYQLQELQQQTQTEYAGKKVQVSVRDSSKQPVETVWFDQRNGYRSNVTKKRSFTGTITEVLLEKNALVLRPAITSRLMNGSLRSYIVYIIDPETSTPMVELTMR